MLTLRCYFLCSAVVVRR